MNQTKLGVLHIGPYLLTTAVIFILEAANHTKKIAKNTNNSTKHTSLSHLQEEPIQVFLKYKEAQLFTLWLDWNQTELCAY